MLLVVLRIIILITMVGGDIEKDQDYYFPSLQKITSEISNQVDADSFVALKPNKPFTGGFGNVLWHYLEVQGLAMATKRHAIVNNAVINALFSHPNLKNSATSTTYWQLKNLNEVQKHYEGGGKPGMKSKTELFPCGKVSTFPITSFSKDFYVHGGYERHHHLFIHRCCDPHPHPLLHHISSLFSGCFGNNLMHPNIKPFLMNLLGLQKIDGRYASKRSSPIGGVVYLLQPNPTQPSLTLFMSFQHCRRCALFLSFSLDVFQSQTTVQGHRREKNP